MAYKARIVADAEGEAERFAKLLAAYERAPAVTRQRLYYETIEEVLGNTNKVLVDTKGTGNMIYLPLDKLMEQRGQPRSGTVTVEPSQSLPLEGAMGSSAQPDLRSRGGR